MIGIIGYGNMAKALIGGMVDSGMFEPDYIIVSGRSDYQLAEARAKGVITTSGNKKVAAQADILIIATKPNQYEAVITEIESYLQPHTIVVSIAAGLTLERLESYFTKPMKIIRTMPNTPGMVKKGMTAMVANTHATEKDLERVRRIFDSVGQTEVITEDLMHAAIVTAGSAPAYLYMVIEAMINGGQHEGMSRAQAEKFVTQAVIGAAEMVRTSTESPLTLRDNVCSPGGTTIEAVKVLEAANVMDTIEVAMKACSRRSKEMEEEM